MTPDGELFDPNTQSFAQLPAPLSTVRSHHTATVLQDGRVLFAGGYQDPFAGKGTASTEIWDPATGTSAPAAPMSAGRVLHTATPLADGRVLVAGGVGVLDPLELMPTLQSALRSTEIYDPVLDQWTAGPDLPAPVFGHGASRLPDGRVLLTAGVSAIDLFGVFIAILSGDSHLIDAAGVSLLPGPPIPATTGLASVSYTHLTLPTIYSV